MGLFGDLLQKFKAKVDQAESEREQGLKGGASKIKAKWDEEAADWKLDEWRKRIKRDLDADAF